MKEEEPQAAAGAGAGRGQKNVLAALSGAGARRPQKSFAAVWALLFLVAAGGGGGGFYYYQYVFLPSQTPADRVDDAGRDTTPTVVDDGAKPKPDADSAVKPDKGVEPVADAGRPPRDTTSPVEPAFDEAKAPKRLKVPIARGLAVEFVIVPSGRFTIGSDQKGDSFADARPRRAVELTKAFYIGRFEVTVAQFAAYLGDAKPRGVEEMALDKMGIEVDEGTYLPFPGNRKFPVRAITHKDARAYCRWMSKKTGLKVDLPGEIQWEYAARGPESRVYPWGDEWDDALCNGGKKDDLVEVGTYPDGASWCGAEDMAGNVFEWCADRYDKTRYRSLPRKDPAVLGKGSSSGLRVMRGGAYCHDPGICSSAYRFAITGAAGDDILGFRVRVRATAAVTQYAADE